MKPPKLRDDLTIVEQTYRGEQSFIVKEHATHKYFRFKLLEIMVMQQFDGERSFADAAAALTEQGLPLKPSAIEGFARKLNQMGLLERTMQERSVLLMERLRAERNRRVKKTHYQGSILRMRFSVGDPNDFFDRWTPRIGFFFSKPFLAMSVVLFAFYPLLIASKWPVMMQVVRTFYTPSLYTVQFFVVFWVTAVTVIVIHELGHGFCCKHFGGEVHEMGAMIIYGNPAFYCNVNDAWTFPELKARLWVTAAGSWIQMVVASLAAIVLWVVQPGTLVSQIMAVAVLIGGVTTVLANANPLIPLDGYYALSDYLEIPNMRQRALGYIGWLLRHHVLRLAVPEPPVEDRERRIFLIYGGLALLYTTSMLTLLVSRLFGWVSGAFGALGAIAFLFFLWSALRRAVRTWVQAVLTGFREHRSFWTSRTVWKRGGIVAGGIVLLALLLPMPIEVRGVFTTAAPLDVTLTAADDAVLARVIAGEGTRVPAGAPVLVLRDFELERAAVVLRRSADSLAAREAQARARGASADVARLGSAREEATANLTALRARIDQLTLRAPVAGVVATARLEEMVGRRFERGDIVVRLLGSPDTLELRVALERAGATLVRPGQTAHVVPYSDVGAAASLPVATVSAAGAGDSSEGQFQARVIVPAGRAYRPGVTGEAAITVRRSNVIGALWWGIRKRVRTDLLL
jgi:putative peptide zinc metalloprotease protein